MRRRRPGGGGETTERKSLLITGDYIAAPSAQQALDNLDNWQPIGVAANAVVNRLAVINGFTIADGSIDPSADEHDDDADVVLKAEGDEFVDIDAVRPGGAP